mmetsp:Transcript_60226/g.170759  ORF Transcript_60226/g.170759 Transcript_60226/m.170759 type:complete len:260 (+) Transcript_60226:732-1511(+)
MLRPAAQDGNGGVHECLTEGFLVEVRCEIAGGHNLEIEQKGADAAALAHCHGGVLAHQVHDQRHINAGSQSDVPGECDTQVCLLYRGAWLVLQAPQPNGHPRAALCQARAVRATHTIALQPRAQGVAPLASRADLASGGLELVGPSTCRARHARVDTRQGAVLPRRTRDADADVGLAHCWLVGAHPALLASALGNRSPRHAPSARGTCLAAALGRGPESAAPRARGAIDAMGPVVGASHSVPCARGTRRADTVVSGTQL